MQGRRVSAKTSAQRWPLELTTRRVPRPVAEIVGGARQCHSHRRVFHSVSR